MYSGFPSGPRAHANNRPARPEDLAREQAACAQTVQQRPDSVDAVMAYVALAKAQRQHRGFAKSVREALLLSDQAADNLTKAIELGTRVLGEHDPIVGVAACELGQLAFSKHEYAQACVWFGKGFPLLQEDDSDLEGLRIITSGTYGYSLYRTKQYAEAERLFDSHMAELQAVVPDEVIWTALTAYGVCAALHGDAGFGWTLLERASAARSANADRDAATVVREAKSMVAPLRKCSTAEEWKIAGNMVFQNGDFAAAICLYGVALRKNDFNAKILANRALCFHKLGKFTSARDDALRAHKADPTYKRAVMILCQAHRSLNKLGDALEDAQRLVAMDPEDVASADLLTTVQSELHKQLDGQQQPQAQADVYADDDPADEAERQRQIADADYIAKVARQREEILRKRREEAEDNGANGAAGPQSAQARSEVEMGQGQLSLLKAMAADPTVLSPFLAWYQALTPAQRSTHMKLTCPHMVEKNGGTVTNTGEDLHGMAFITPEITVESLCGGSGDGLKRLIQNISGISHFADLLESAVTTILDASEHQARTPRGQWFRDVIASSGRTYTELASGRSFTVNDKSKGPKQQQREMNAKLQNLIDARALVPRKVYELGMSRASYLVQLPVAWINEWMQDHRPDHPLTDKLFDHTPDDVRLHDRDKL
jgi:tetratricopeptide (TPR) repeat protein